MDALFTKCKEFFSHLFQMPLYFLLINFQINCYLFKRFPEMENIFPCFVSCYLLCKVAIFLCIKYLISKFFFPCCLISLYICHGNQSLIIEHLLKVRDKPSPISSVPMKTKSNMIVNTPMSHCLQGSLYYF